LTTVEIRNAATTILHRNIAGMPHVLMGQRGKTAAFMPNKFVFPGGAVDPEDYVVPLTPPLPAALTRALSADGETELAHALAVAGIRELWEEAGLILGQNSPWDIPVPADWTEFADQGYSPDATGLQFIFRAITPPGPKRRFDARFFLVDAKNLATDPDDFSAASDELSGLQWVSLEDSRGFDLPFITEVVLAEVAQILRTGTGSEGVPFFKNDDERNLFLRLNSGERDQ
jgi:8-oxo-dGTP pyrophosphatase MutT (NUDIX family)